MGKQHSERKGTSEEIISGCDKLSEDNLDASGGSVEDTSGQAGKNGNIKDIIKKFPKGSAVSLYSVQPGWLTLLPSIGAVRSTWKKLEEENKRLKEEIEKLEKQKSQPGIEPIQP